MTRETRMPLIPPTLAWIKGPASLTTAGGGGGEDPGQHALQQRVRVEHELAVTLGNTDLAMMLQLVRQPRG